MGKARALRLGIVKGLKRSALAILPKTYKCPICKFQFNAYDVALEAKERNIDPETIVAGHIKSCIQSAYPNQKSDCLMCKEEGRTTKLKISELDAHIAKEHSEEKEIEDAVDRILPDDVKGKIISVEFSSHADNPDRNSVDAESRSSTLVTKESRDVESFPITSNEGNISEGLATGEKQMSESGVVEK